MNKLLLIDGSSVLSRNYYGSLPNSVKFAKTPEEKELGMKDTMKTKDGLYTNGLYAMMKFLLKVIKEQQPTHMIVAWDVSRDTFRKDMYPDYKATRSETPEALKLQFELAKKTLEYIGMKQYMLEKYEADDIIGTFAKKFESDIPTYIITGDQDALQLVTDHTKVWFTTTKAKEWYEERGVNVKELNIPDKTFEYTTETVEENYGLQPIQIIDMKALEGDASDNIPGVKGISTKTALPLLKEYGTIERIYEAVESIPEKELKQFFKEELGIRSPISYLLKKSNTEIAEEIQALLETEMNKKSIKEAINLFKEVGDKGFKEKVKVLAEADESLFKEKAVLLTEELKQIDTGVVGKEAAYLSKELATIKTDIEEFKEVKLNELVIQLNENKMKKIFERLEFKSII